jgi:2,6-dihydroxypseudooxynicotine hydrolase
MDKIMTRTITRAAGPGEMQLCGEISYLTLMGSKNLHYRFISQGIDFSVVDNTMSAIKVQADWFPSWMAAGDRYRELAETALAQRQRITTGQLFMKAALSYHWAQCLHFSDLEEKKRGQAAKVAAYRKAHEFLTPPMRQIDVPYEGVTLPVVVRTPSEKGRHPVVVMVCGSDSTMEENFAIENEFLRRGLATVSFDGPGQGDVWSSMKMRPDFHAAVTKVLDAVIGLPGIDPDRIGILGKSFGGLLAPAAAASDKRFKCCIVNGGYFDTKFYDWSEPLRSVRFQFLLGAKTLDETKILAREYDLANYINDVHVPLLVMHGGRDKIPSSQAKRIAEDAGRPGKYVEFADGIHCFHNISYITTPYMADWFIEQLK